MPDTPAFVNTGLRDTNVADQFPAVVVGTFFKKDGIFENPVDRDRVERFMEIVRSVR